MKNEKQNTDKKEIVYCYSKHARDNRQRRGITDDMIGLLLECGVWGYSNGRKILHLQNKRAQESARSFMDSVGMQLDNHLHKLYAVVADDGIIVTVGWRTKPILHNWNPHKDGKRNRNRNRNRTFDCWEWRD